MHESGFGGGNSLMYGGGGTSGAPRPRGPPKERRATPRGQMALSADSKPPIADLPYHLKAMFGQFKLQPADTVAPGSHPVIQQQQVRKSKHDSKRREKTTDDRVAGNSDEEEWQSHITGLAEFKSAFIEASMPCDDDDLEIGEQASSGCVGQWPMTREMVRQLQSENKQREARSRTNAAKAVWDPRAPEAAAQKTARPYNTLFVGRLGYEVTEQMLERELCMFGKINRIIVVRDVIPEGASSVGPIHPKAKGHHRGGTGLSRGYAFCEFDDEGDMAFAYKKLKGGQIFGRKVIVDVERGRTTRNWLPQRLGGGVEGRPDQPNKHEIRRLQEEQRRQQHQYRGGPRGGPQRRDEGRDNTCYDFRRGNCHRGSNCRYAHTEPAGGNRETEHDPRSSGMHRDRDRNRPLPRAYGSGGFGGAPDSDRCDYRGGHGDRGRSRGLERGNRKGDDRQGYGGGSAAMYGAGTSRRTDRSRSRDRDGY